MDISRSDGVQRSGPTAIWTREAADKGQWQSKIRSFSLATKVMEEHANRTFPLYIVSVA
jgi:hypothetical protein